MLHWNILMRVYTGETLRGVKMALLEMEVVFVNMSFSPLAYVWNVMAENLM